MKATAPSVNIEQNILNMLKGVLKGCEEATMVIATSFVQVREAFQERELQGSDTPRWEVGIKYPGSL